MHSNNINEYKTRTCLYVLVTTWCGQLCYVMYGMSSDPETQLCQHAQMTDKNMEKSWHSWSNKHTLRWQSSSKNRWEQKRATSNGFYYSKNQLFATLLSSLRSVKLLILSV